jgi:hypothetical protein
MNAETLPCGPNMVVRINKGFLAGKKGIILTVNGTLCHVLVDGVLLHYLINELEVL